jgi:hypothetical protein
MKNNTQAILLIDKAKGKAQTKDDSYNLDLIQGIEKQGVISEAERVYLIDYINN